MKLSISIITKDQPESTANCVRSCRSLLLDGDEVVILDTGSSESNLAALKRALPEIDGVAVKVHYEPTLSVDLTPYLDAWLPDKKQAFLNEKGGQYKDARGILDFAATRNRAKELCSGELLFFIDSDDILVEEVPGRLREVVEHRLQKDSPHSSLFLRYVYAKAADGTVTCEHKRERVVRRDAYEWRGRVHETLVPLPGKARDFVYFEDLNTYIEHTDARKDPGISDVRNYIIHRKELEETKGEPDPRTLLYIANACRGLHRFQEAIGFYKLFDARSGSLDDRFAAAMHIGDIYFHPDMQRPIDGLDWYQKAADLKPDDPRGWFGISKAHYARHRFEDCLRMYEFACNLPDPVSRTLHVVNPLEVHYAPHIIAALAAKELRRPDFALACIHRALQFRPTGEEARKAAEYLKAWLAGTKLAESLNHVAAHAGNNPTAVRLLRTIYDFIPAVPEDLEKAGVGMPPASDPRPKQPEIVLWCGQTLESWGPDSARTGIGGSEKMVILLAPALQRLGYNVTVYADVPYPQRGVHQNGVRWLHFSQYEPRAEPVEALIVWRNPQGLFLQGSAKKRILWTHDVQNPATYTKEVLAVVDHVLVQSKYHGREIAPILGDKLVQTHNAIVRPVCFKVDNPERDPKRVLYCSSPDRGLTTALRIVQEAQKVDPAINITVLYGFTPYERKIRARWDHRYIPDLGRDAGLDDYERYCGRLIDATGAKMLNRIGFDRVWTEMLAAGVWLYPTRFPEISCMSAMEAQGAGMVCVSTRFAALDETLLPEALHFDLGPVEDTPAYIERAASTLIEATKIDARAPARVVSSKAAFSRFSVERLAKAIKGLLYDAGRGHSKPGAAAGESGRSRAQATSAGGGKP